MLKGHWHWHHLHLRVSWKQVNDVWFVYVQLLLQYKLKKEKMVIRPLFAQSPQTELNFYTWVKYEQKRLLKSF